MMAGIYCDTENIINVVLPVCLSDDTDKWAGAWRATLRTVRERERWNSQMVLQAAARQAPKGSGWGLFSGFAAVLVCHLNFPDPEKVPSFVFPLWTHSHTQEQWAECVLLLRSAAENSNGGKEKVQSSCKSVCLQVYKPELNWVIYDLWGSDKSSDKSSTRHLAQTQTTTRLEFFTT